MTWTACWRCGVAQPATETACVRCGVALLEDYVLPDGTRVAVDATAAKHAPIIDFTLKGGQIVQATRADLVDE